MIIKPNADNPINADAAKLYTSDYNQFKTKAADYTKKFAKWVGIDLQGL